MQFMRGANHESFKIAYSKVLQQEPPVLMRLRSLSFLLVCLVAIVLTGFGRFARGSVFPRHLMDALFIASVLAGLTVSLYLVTRRLSLNATEEINDIEDQGRK